MKEVKMETGSAMLNSPRVYYMCSYVPLEIFRAFDLEPIRTIGGPAENDENERLIHQNVCGYLKNILNSAKRGDRNMFFTDCCDGSVKLRDIWNCFFDDAITYLITLPNRIEPEAIAFWKAQLQKLVSFLEQKTGKKYDPERLKSAIKEYNVLRKEMKRVEGLLLEGKILGSQYLSLMLDAQMSNIIEATKKVRALYEESKDNETRDFDFRILETGSVLVDVSLAELVEENGSNIVYFDTCTGSRFYEGLTPEDGDPLQAIADRYYKEKIPCARMQFSEKRREHVMKIIKEQHIDGVIMRLEKFCPVWSLEYYPMRKLFEKNDIGFVGIESNYDFETTSQVKTRVEALLEMLA